MACKVLPNELNCIGAHMHSELNKGFHGLADNLLAVAAEA
jgi:hypothetical protein